MLTNNSLSDDDKVEVAGTIPSECAMKAPADLPEINDGQESTNNNIRNGQENISGNGERYHSSGHWSSTTSRQEEIVDAEAAEDLNLEPITTVSTRTPIYSIFTKNQKRLVVVMTAMGSFFSPLTANIYFPALETLATDLSVSSSSINLTITSYMIFQGIAPTFFGDLADMAGRRPAYGIGFIVYIAANIGLALQNNFAALLVLRMLQSTGSSGNIALGNGIVGDIATSAERGTYMSFVSAGAMIGPALSPIVGGLLSQYLGWRAIFWFLTILSAAYLIPFLIIFPETGRNVVGNGSIPPPKWDMSLLSYLQTRKNPPEVTAQAGTRRKLRFPNPLASIHILLEKDVGLFLLYNGIVFTSFYCVTATIPSQFKKIYGFNDLHIGLSFIPFGVGCCASALTVGHLQDRNYKRIAKKMGFTIDRRRGDDLRNFPIERARIEVALPLLYVGTTSVLCFGWSLYAEAHLAVPLAITAIGGYCLTGTSNCMNTLLIDLYPMSPATATAANNLVRCLLGAVGTAVIVDIVNAIGNGWAFTIVSGIVFATSPMLWAEMYRGSKWREERRVRIGKMKEREAMESTESFQTEDDEEGEVTTVEARLGQANSGTQEKSGLP
ncbi:MAG: hypothetical protein M1834_003892 [Cirrosporium novae-zelandiae]|nr:MAG: hypothetical protein M1834_003892 [Cirrosporium novae-zelandiae]